MATWVLRVRRLGMALAPWDDATGHRLMGQDDLELVRVTKSFGRTIAVDAVDLRVPGGSYCCLLGPSGCGKTSTLRMIAGHDSVSEGDIIISRNVVTDLPPALRCTAM